MDQDNIISTLNDLIEVSRDGEEGFRTSAEHANNAQLKSMFANHADGCASAIRELQNAVQAQGGDPSSTGTISGALHRRWVDIKSLVTGQDDEAILTEVERGEDVAVSTYKKAVTQGLPSEIQNIVERQYQNVLRNHDQVKQLRNQAKSAHH
jgi:uncharacterized protein (TIGR02284 family)